MLRYIDSEFVILLIMSYRFLALFFSAAIVSFTAFAGVIKDGSLRGTSDGSNITIRWESDDETNVARFVLERKAGIHGVFVPLTELSPKGNNSSYLYVDETAFRTSESLYQYRVKVMFTNGTAPVTSGTITVSHRTSEVRRTWGSIKAMFR